jgi:hypothetical protein
MRDEQRPGRVGRQFLKLTLLGVVLLSPAVSSGQEQYKYASRKAYISSNIRGALAPAKLGLNLLQTATSDEQIVRASDAIFSSYRQLRAAQEWSEKLESEATLPDPMITLRNARIQGIRDRLRYCRDKDAMLIRRDPEVTSTCLAGLVEAIHNLEIVVAVEN